MSVYAYATKKRRMKGGKKEFEKMRVREGKRDSEERG